MTPSKIIEQARKHGIIGMGGAGFSTAKKLEAEAIRTVIINDIECEPNIFSDAYLIANTPNLLEDAKRLLNIRWPGCKIILGVKSRSSTLTSEVKVEDRDLTPSEYPHGAEKLLIEKLCGITLKSYEHPTDHGIVCFNVTTLKHLIDAVIHDKPVTERIVTLNAPSLSQPIVESMPLGSTIESILNKYQINYQNMDIFEGGHYMHRRVALTDTIQATTHGILLKPITQHVEQPCIKCGDCNTVCPRPIQPESLLKTLQQGEDGRSESLDLCITCHLCDTVCPSHIPLAQTFKQAQQNLQTIIHKEKKAEIAKARFEAKSSRQERREALKNKRRLAKLQAAQSTEDKQAMIKAAIERAKRSRLLQDSVPRNDDVEREQLNET